MNLLIGNRTWLRVYLIDFCKALQPSVQSEDIEGTLRVGRYCMIYLSNEPAHTKSYIEGMNFSGRRVEVYEPTEEKELYTK